MWFLVEELSILFAVGVADIFVMFFAYNVGQDCCQGCPKNTNTMNIHVIKLAIKNLL